MIERPLEPKLNPLHLGWILTEDNPSDSQPANHWKNCDHGECSQGKQHRSAGSAR
jgi:hypothetical protein